MPQLYTYSDNHNIVYSHPEKGDQALTNFAATIDEERQIIDGERVKREYTISGTREDGTKLPSVNISAEEFSGMNWIADRWGSQAIIYPVSSAKDHTRTAIQIQSDPKITRTWTSTGWHEIDGVWTYLSQNESIDNKGIHKDRDVTLPADLKPFKFAAGKVTNTTTKPALKDTLDLPDLITTELGWLMIAAAYTAPFGADFAIHVTGRTGTYKSEIAAIAQSHFGGFTSRNLPCSWSSTANSIEALCYRAKDALIVIDDFIPSGTSYQQRAYQQSADRIMRAAGNQAGRARLTDVSSHQQTMYPRGLILSTGEDTPEGHSVRGRMLITEISPGDVTAKNLTKAQKLKVPANTAMAGYIHYIAKDYPTNTTVYQQIANDQRDKNLSIGHSRTPSTIGKLQAGLITLAAYARQLKLPDKTIQRILNEGCEAIKQIGTRQHDFLVATDPADQFVMVLRGICGAAAGHIKARNGGLPHNAPTMGWSQIGDDGRDWKPHGPRLGWEDRERNTLYLDAQVVYDAVRRHSRGTITVTRQTLYKRLREAGKLQSYDDNRQRNTVRVQLEGAGRTVLALNLTEYLNESQE